MSAVFDPTWFPYPLHLVVYSKDKREPEMFSLLNVASPVHHQGEMSLLPVFTSVYQAQRFIETNDESDAVTVALHADDDFAAALQQAKALRRTHIAFDPPQTLAWPDVYAIDDVIHVITQRMP